MKKIFTVLMAVFVLAIAVPASAQKKDPKQNANTRSVQGAVLTADDDPIEGAVVQLKDTRSLTIRSFITRANGTFQFQGLSPDVDYELKAESKGKTSSAKTLSSFDSRKQAVMNLKLDK
ncbi:MAG: carboxypeptidase regulatory-like domain-containing protein [Bryobacteraceae bacterium]|nr:carboxypeptidase regulatory-like domain-containing protein [Bryobacteraceae bacterium]